MLKLEQLKWHSDKRTLDGYQLVKISVTAQGTMIINAYLMSSCVAPQSC